MHFISIKATLYKRSCLECGPPPQLFSSERKEQHVMLTADYSLMIHMLLRVILR